MEKEKIDCPCTWKECPRHKDCDECKIYHHAIGDTTSCGKWGAPRFPYSNPPFLTRNAVFSTSW